MTRKPTIIPPECESEGIQSSNSRSVLLNACEAENKASTVFSLRTFKAIAEVVQQINRRLHRDPTGSPISTQRLEESRRSNVREVTGGDVAGENCRTHST